MILVFLRYGKHHVLREELSALPKGCATLHDLQLDYARLQQQLNKTWQERRALRSGRIGPCPVVELMRLDWAGQPARAGDAEDPLRQPAKPNAKPKFQKTLRKSPPRGRRQIERNTTN